MLPTIHPFVGRLLENVFWVKQVDFFFFQTPAMSPLFPSTPHFLEGTEATGSPFPVEESPVPKLAPPPVAIWVLPRLLGACSPLLKDLPPKPSTLVSQLATQPLQWGVDLPKSPGNYPPAKSFITTGAHSFEDTPRPKHIDQFPSPGLVAFHFRSLKLGENYHPGPNNLPRNFRGLPPPPQRSFFDAPGVRFFLNFYGQFFRLNLVFTMEGDLPGPQFLSTLGRGSSTFNSPG